MLQFFYFPFFRSQFLIELHSLFIKIEFMRIQITLYFSFFRLQFSIKLFKLFKWLVHLGFSTFLEFIKIRLSHIICP